MPADIDVAVRRNLLIGPADAGGGGPGHEQVIRHDIGHRGGEIVHLAFRKADRPRPGDRLRSPTRGTDTVVELDVVKPRDDVKVVTVVEPGGIQHPAGRPGTGLNIVSPPKTGSVVVTEYRPGKVRHGQTLRDVEGNVTDSRIDVVELDIDLVPARGGLPDDDIRPIRRGRIADGKRRTGCGDREVRCGRGVAEVIGIGRSAGSADIASGMNLVVRGGNADGIPERHGARADPGAPDDVPVTDGRNGRDRTGGRAVGSELYVLRLDGENEVAFLGGVASCLEPERRRLGELQNKLLLPLHGILLGDFLPLAGNTGKQAQNGQRNEICLLHIHPPIAL